jgi:hypothetical protein
VALGSDIANIGGDEEGSLFYDMGKMFSLCFRANYQNLSIENPTNDPFGTSEFSGIGDLDPHLLGIAYPTQESVNKVRNELDWLSLVNIAVFVNY